MCAVRISQEHPHAVLFYVLHFISDESIDTDPNLLKLNNGHILRPWVLNLWFQYDPQISVQALAHAVDVPVWVERQNVDLKICMFDRLYQDTIIVNNRATTALRLKFEVCKELKNHMELLPKTGYIQAQSQFSAQLKFLPRSESPFNFNMSFHGFFSHYNLGLITFSSFYIILFHYNFGERHLNETYEV